MEKIESCHKCGKTSKVYEIVMCDKVKKPMCRDCCVLACGVVKKCENWNLCWPSVIL